MPLVEVLCIPQVVIFTEKLNAQDTEAVAAEMILAYSQGQIEGWMNKLKPIKRSIYGRGEFD